MTITRPKALTLGAKVALIAPSSPVDSEALLRSVRSVRFMGLVPVLYPSAVSRHGYLSGTDERRARDMNNAFADPEVAGVFCLRGGYGGTRILPLLDYELIRKHPKLFLGYSDITAFHVAFQQLCGLATLHSPMPSGGWETLDNLTLASLSAHLFRSVPVGPAVMPEGEHLKAVVSGIAEGPITGGNLSLLAATLGSPYEVDTRGKLLFIEDVEERPYQVDRGLTALALAGKFKDCSGVILGTFTGCEETEYAPEDTLTLEQIFQEVIAPFGKPTVSNFRAGHQYPHISIPMGVNARLDADRGLVRFEEALTR